MNRDDSKDSKIIVFPAAKSQLAQESLNNFRVVAPEISFKKAQKLLEEAKVDFLSNTPIPKIHIQSISDSVMKEKSKEIKKDTGNLPNLDLMIYDCMLLAELPLLADYFLSNYKYRYRTGSYDKTRDKIFQKIYNKQGSVGIEEYSRDVTEKNGEFWGAFVNQALAVNFNANYTNQSESLSMLGESSELLDKASSLINRQYSNADKIANPELLIVDVALGDVSFIRGVKDDKNVEHHWKSANKHYNKALDGGFCCEELYRNLGGINTYKSKYSEAYESLANAIMLNPYHNENYIASYYALKKNGALKEAESFLGLAAYIDQYDPNFIKAKADFEEVTGGRLDIKFEDIPPSDDPAYEDIRIDHILDTADEQLKALDDLIQNPKTSDINDQIKTFSTLVNQADMNLKNGIESKSYEPLLSAEKNLFKAGLAFSSSKLNSNFIAVYSCMGAYDQGTDILNKFLFHPEKTAVIKYPHQDISDSIAEMKEVVNDPNRYMKHAQERLTRRSGEWTAHSDMGSAYILASGQLQGEKRLKYLDLAYNHYNMSEALLLKMAKKLGNGISPESFKKVYPFTNGPRFKMGFTRLLQYIETVKSEKPNLSYLKEAQQKITDAKEHGYESEKLYFALGLIDSLNGDVQKAVANYNHSLLFDKKSLKPVLEIANTLMDLGDLSNASLYIDNAFGLSQKDPKVISTFKRYTTLLNEQTDDK